MKKISENIKVSVIIPTYKRANEIEKAVKSVQKQTLKEIEIIIVDDNDSNSEDRLKTKKIVEEYQKTDTRIKYIEHEKNLNGSVARNTGIKHANGKYIAFLDDDDEYLPNKLEIQYLKMEELPKVYGGVISNCAVYRNNQKIEDIDVDSEENSLIKVLACKYQIGSGSNIFIRSNIISEIGTFDERLLRHQDYDFLVRFFTKYNIYKISESLFNIEQRSSNQNVPNLKKLENAKKIYLTKYKDLILSLTEEEQKYIYYNQYISLCEVAIKNKDMMSFKKYYLKAKSYKKLSLKQKIRFLLLKIYWSMPQFLKNKILLGR